jgi:hypothetical protein
MPSKSIIATSLFVALVLPTSLVSAAPLGEPSVELVEREPIFGLVKNLFRGGRRSLEDESATLVARTKTPKRPARVTRHPLNHKNLWGQTTSQGSVLHQKRDVSDEPALALATRARRPFQSGGESTQISLYGTKLKSLLIGPGYSGPLRKTIRGAQRSQTRDLSDEEASTLAARSILSTLTTPWKELANRPPPVSNRPPVRKPQKRKRDLLDVLEADLEARSLGGDEEELYEREPIFGLVKGLFRGGRRDLAGFKDIEEREWIGDLDELD